MSDRVELCISKIREAVGQNKILVSYSKNQVLKIPDLFVVTSEHMSSQCDRFRTYSYNHFFVGPYRLCNMHIVFYKQMPSLGCYSKLICYFG